MLRLWKFRRQEDVKELHVTLALFSEAERPKYVALSYAWGESSEPKQAVVVNNCYLYVTRSLFDFLMCLQTDDVCCETWYWSDQISMNQEDLAERDHQVGLMGDIFSNAQTVFAWLGLIERDSIWATNFELTIVWMATRKYWNRVWIVQELRPADSITFWCGRTRVSARAFMVHINRRERTFSDVLYWLMANRNIGEAIDETNLDILSRQDDLRRRYWPKIQMLLDTDRSVWKVRSSLAWVLSSYCENECSDRRDEVYGLQALVQHGQRVPVDYSLTTHQLAFRAISIMIVQAPLPNVFDSCWSFTNHHSRSLDASFARFDKITESLAVSNQISRMLLWSHMLPRISVDTERAWGSTMWLAWISMWRQVKEVAGSPAQALLADELCRRAEDYVDPSDFSQQPSEDVLDRGSLVDYARSMVDDAAANHGFVKYEQFLCHPENWSCPDDVLLLEGSSEKAHDD